MTIVIGKLIDSTEMIGEIVEETEHQVTISRPLSIIYKHSLESDVPKVSFVKYMTFVDVTDITLNKTDFIVCAEASEYIIDVYKRMANRLFPSDNETGAQLDVATERSKLYARLLEVINHEVMTMQ